MKKTPMKMVHLYNLLLCFIVFVGISLITTSSQDVPVAYDPYASTECKQLPEKPLYGGGILKDQEVNYQWVQNMWGFRSYIPSFVLPELIPGNYYAFSSWVKISGMDSTVLWANVGNKKTCGASVVAKQDCWTFLKGGFYITEPLNTSVLHFEDFNGNNIHIDVASASLQIFSEEQWRAQQQDTIERVRKRKSKITIVDEFGSPAQRANVTVEQISRGFPFGVAISGAILTNPQYQEWVKSKRFDVTVFENEMKWPANEPGVGKVNYTIPDLMLDFATNNNMMVRGHNVVWQDEDFAPWWTRNLTAAQLRRAVDDRIKGVVGRYKGKFIHWDVNNEMLHYDYYERVLGDPNASLEFYKMAQEIDPNTPLFFNDFKVVEICGNSSTVDAYIAKIRDFQRAGINLMGMGLEGHWFDQPNPVYTRAVLDKLATVNIPIWITELDATHQNGPEPQAAYLEAALREVYAHPAIEGIIVWSAVNNFGFCWQMCLTQGLDFDRNTLAGDVVDKLLDEWRTGTVTGVTDGEGAFGFDGFLGTYRVSVDYVGDYDRGHFETTVSLLKGFDTQNIEIRM